MHPEALIYFKWYVLFKQHYQALKWYEFRKRLVAKKLYLKCLKKSFVAQEFCFRDN
jgi:hypothetical protein